MESREEELTNGNSKKKGEEKHDSTIKYSQLEFSKESSNDILNVSVNEITEEGVNFKTDNSKLIGEDFPESLLDTQQAISKQEKWVSKVAKLANKPKNSASAKNNSKNTKKGKEKKTYRKMRI